MEKPSIDIPIGIPEFYKGKVVFVTGFTGYIGSLLVEKLLYSCPEVSKVYVLVRNKKGRTPKERAEEVMSSRAFNRLRADRPGIMESKVIAIFGDIFEDRLGLSHEDEELLKREVNIIFHGAASVRFDDPLPVAIRMNTHGTKKIVDLALGMPNLLCMAYISTAYTNCDHIYIKEEVYPPRADWRNTIDVCSKIDPTVVETLQYKYINKLPNTYVFSKSLAEQVINDYADRLPIVLVRPSIVFPALKEPEPGWTGNKYGVVGLCIGFFLGIVRCSWVDVKTKCNYIPCDLAINAILIATWKTSLTRKPGQIVKSVPVYNACSVHDFNYNHLEFSQIHEEGELTDWVENDRLNYTHLSFYPSEFEFKMQNLIKHVLPALMVDSILLLIRRQPILMTVRRKVFAAACALSYFATKTFLFQTDNFFGLVDDLKPEDREEFGWNFNEFSLVQIYKNVPEIIKHTFLKPLYDDIDGFRNKLRMLYAVDRFAVYLTYSLAIYVLYYFSIPQFIFAGVVSFLTLP